MMAGVSIDADPRQLQVHRDPPQRDVPYVPTDEPVVAAMLRFAHVGPADVLYDLGCGDGRIVIAAARLCGARGVGVDIDPQRIAEAREHARRARVEDRVRFLCQSFFETDLHEASVVALYLLPSINVKLRPKLLEELRPGARIIANHFDMGDWKPDMQAYAHHRTLHQWIVPAWVAGKWKCVVNHPSGRYHLGLELRRRFQVVSGTARKGRQNMPLLNGRLFADHLTFKLVDWARPGPAIRFNARIEGTQLRGTCHEGWDGLPIEWGGRWVGSVGRAQAGT